MSTIVLEEMVPRARQLADVENATNRFPDAEVQDYMKTADRKWRDFLFNNGGAHLLEVTNTPTTTAGVATVNRPLNMARLLGIDATVGGVTRTLRPLPRGERNRFNFDGVSWQSRRQIYYRLAGPARITFYPTPDGAYTLTIYYVEDGDTDFSTTGFFTGFNGWEEFIILETAWMILDKDNRRSDHIQRRLADLKESIISSIRGQDDGEPQVVTDVANQHGQLVFPWC